MNDYVQWKVALICRELDEQDSFVIIIETIGNEILNEIEQKTNRICCY
jgi:hypothetical protein